MSMLKKTLFGGLELDVLEAVLANVLSWIVVTFCPSYLPYLLPKIDVAIEDEDENATTATTTTTTNNTRCIAIGRPGGNEQLRMVTLKPSYVTRGYNVVLPSEEKLHNNDNNNNNNKTKKLVASSPFVDVSDTTNLPEGTVVVKIHAFSVNYADCCIRWGLYESANRFVGWPIVPGFDIAGVVEQVIPFQKTTSSSDSSSQQEEFKVGDRVYGATFFGGYSTRCLVPMTQLRKIPSLSSSTSLSEMSFAQAASIPAVSITALYALYLGGMYTLPTVQSPTKTTAQQQQQQTNNNNNNNKTKSNRSILIHSAAGGVGSMMVQMAKILQLGPIVGVVGRTSKVETAHNLGCDVVIDKSDHHSDDPSSSSSWWKTITDTTIDTNGYAVVADANGVSTLRQSMNVLAPTGRLIVFGFHSNLPMGQDMLNPICWISMARKKSQMPKFDPMDLVKDNKSVLGFNLSFFVDEIHMLGVMYDQISSWLSSGQLVCPKVTEMYMGDIQHAHEFLQSGKSVGKIVMTCDPPQ